MKKNNYLFIIIFLASCNFSSSLQQEEISNPKGIKQKFMFKLFNYGVEIYLREDFLFKNFSYSFGCIGGYRVKEVLGEYKMENNHIYFSPEKLIWKEDWEEGHYYFNTTKTFDTLNYYHSDSNKIQLKYWHLRKDNFEFLVSETPFYEQDEYFILSSNFIGLANLYNANCENKICASVFCNIDTTLNIRNIISKKDIPEKFEKLFLDEPIDITIRSVNVEKKYGELIPIYKLTSDEIDDIFIGMKFYSKKHPNFPITIIDKKDDILIAEGIDIFHFNTKLSINTILKSEKQ